MAAKLEELPKSENKFWDGAQKISAKPVYKECKHHFERRLGGLAFCKGCNIGYLLAGREYLKNGHIYSGGKLLI